MAPGETSSKPWPGAGDLRQKRGPAADKCRK
jgi:hypothetical protein